VSILISMALHIGTAVDHRIKMLYNELRETLHVFLLLPDSLNLEIRPQNTKSLENRNI
jgi:hypothetical protein